MQNMDHHHHHHLVVVVGSKLNLDSPDLLDNKVCKALALKELVVEVLGLEVLELEVLELEDIRTIHHLPLLILKNY